jgi:hypothetical protein
MLRVGFELTTPVFEWTKTARGLDCADALIDRVNPFFFHWHYSPSGPKPTSMKLSVSLRFFF